MRDRPVHLPTLAIGIWLVDSQGPNGSIVRRKVTRQSGQVVLLSSASLSMK